MIGKTDGSSRAGSLALIGRELALDFTNTSSGRGSSLCLEHLQEADHVVIWALHAKVLSVDGGASNQRVLAKTPSLAARLLRRTLALREAIYAAGEAVADGRNPDITQLAELTGCHTACLQQARFHLRDDNFAWDWDPAETPVESILGPVSLSALRLLTQGDLIRYREVRKFLSGAFFVSSGILWYLWVNNITIPIVIPYAGEVSVESPAISGQRAIVHFALFLACFYFGFVKRPKKLD